MSDGPFLRALFGLEGRVALVSGARQGIGEAIAEGLARAGAAVALTSRDRAGLGPLAERLGALGARTLALELELSEPRQIEGCVADTVAAFGRLDILVNNAGLSVHADAFDLELEDWDRVFATNLRGAFLLARAAARGHEGAAAAAASSTSPRRSRASACRAARRTRRARPASSS